jgi:PAS domain S-box-containing protein
MSEAGPAPLSEIKGGAGAPGLPVELFRVFLDTAMDAIITVDEAQRVVLFNTAAEEVFGWRRAEALGLSLDEFIPARFRHGHRDLVRRFGETAATSRRMGHASRVVMGLRRSGEEFPIDASISQVAIDGRKFFSVILRDVTERVRSEEALRASREELKEFAVAANSVREQEKSRIARELHDELGQALTALKIDVGWLREHVREPGEVRAKLAGMQGLIDATVTSARRISADLRPLMLDDLGLLAACEWLSSTFSQRTGIPCEFVASGSDLDLPDPHATAIFRTLQESLTNAAKHAHATQVEATLERGGDGITLTVMDNGRGFETADARRPGSFGLIGLRERAYLLGGSVSVESQPGRGTRVELRLPAPEPR